MAELETVQTAGWLVLRQWRWQTGLQVGIDLHATGAVFHPTPRARERGNTDTASQTDRLYTRKRLTQVRGRVSQSDEQRLPNEKARCCVR